VPPRVSPNAVFLNIPYDNRYRRLYLAYIVGLSYLGLEPRVTLGIPGGERRLDRILALIQSCQFSIHDLSCVQLDHHSPRTPRFNMPFELGLAVAWANLNPKSHSWFVCESKNRRLQKSLSDLNGTDPNIHAGTVEGVMRELCNAFIRPRALMPSVPEMLWATAFSPAALMPSAATLAPQPSLKLAFLRICASPLPRYRSPR
jgi:hypothetical protein